MKSIVLAMAFLCVLFSANPAEARHHHGGRLPWCGIYMGKYFGKSDRSLWVARNWAREGSNAGGPATGVVVVWPHHVGVITGQDAAGRWLVHSGNDGNAVRTRARSLSGVIAYRSIGGSGLSAYADLKGQEQATRRRGKHLVALAVEGGPKPDVFVPLKQPRSVAVVASMFPMSARVDTAALTPPTDRADEPVRKKRKPVMKRERVLVSLFAPMPEAVDPAFSKQSSIKSNHVSPHTQRDQAAAHRSSSQALQRSAEHTPLAFPSWGNDAHAHAGGAVAGSHGYRPGRT